jgi:hypothetical protein
MCNGPAPAASTSSRPAPKTIQPIPGQMLAMLHIPHDCKVV